MVYGCQHTWEAKGVSHLPRRLASVQTKDGRGFGELARLYDPASCQIVLMLRSKTIEDFEARICFHNVVKNITVLCSQEISPLRRGGA